ncbi:MAG: Do family serine endopeptidase [Alphaproteobacteria bacterium]|nr:Do family serine endopeptidase [Alphaproteobacteria bacterium]
MLRRSVLSFLCLVFFLSASPAHAAAPHASYADLAEKLLPAVVNISTTSKRGFDNAEETMPDMPQFPPGSPFEDFFRDFMERHQGMTPQQRKVTSLGSGFIIDPDGLIVTNNHVIQDADEITVILHDDTNLKAEVVGRDKKTDLALLKVKPKKKLQAVQWGDSDKMRVGDPVLAIGNPFGLGGTVTAGIISARARDINSGPYDDYLQTDASINRGNSGGPMFNLDGEVIGINTAIFSPTGGSVGIGFAIPAALAKGIVTQLKDHGYTKRGWLGVKIQTVTDDIASSLGLDKARGALVSEVTPGGPAEKAGLKSGDVITGFDGKDVDEMRRLPRMVAETPVDKKVDIDLWRDGKKRTLGLKLGELKPSDDEDDEDKPTSDAKENTPKADKIDDLGVSVIPLSSDMRKRYSIKTETKGMLVTDVKLNGPADDRGLQSGDIIAEINQKAVTSSDEVKKQVAAAKKDKKPVLMLVERKGDMRFVAVPLRDDKKDKD